VVEQPSAIDEIPRIKRDEIQGHDEEIDNRKRLPTTELGQKIVALIGAKYLTKAQEDQLSVEYEVHSERKGDIKISPVELYETEPLFGEYVGELVKKFKSQLAKSRSNARVFQTRMVDALTIGGGHGSFCYQQDAAGCHQLDRDPSAPGIVDDEYSVVPSDPTLLNLSVQHELGKQMPTTIKKEE
jgi:hypothetical protein